MYIINMRSPKDNPFWKRTKELLRQQKISQKNFTDSIGMNYSTFRFWSCYGYLPDIRTAYDIATTLGVSMEYLLTGIERQAMITSDSLP